MDVLEQVREHAGFMRGLRVRVAAAWRRDASSRLNQRRAAKLLKASPAAESRYVRDVVQIMRSVHAGFLKTLDPAVRPDGARVDAEVAKPFPHGMKNRLFVYIRAQVGPAFDRMGGALDQGNKEGLSLLGIQPAHVPGLAGTIAHAREANIKLVQHAAGDYADQVTSILRDPKNLGLRVEKLRDLLAERGNVSLSRATLIAKDQTLKTNAAISHARMIAAGVTRYTWSTSRDERVRPMHRDLEGMQFDFDDPPVTNEDGDANNPGEDYQCRCNALPVIPELEGPEPEPEEPEEPEEQPEPGEELEEEIPGYPKNPEDIPGYPKDPADEPEGPDVAELPEVPEPPEEIPRPVEPVEPEPRPLEARYHFTSATSDPDAKLSIAEVLGKATHEGLRAWLEAPEHQPNLRVVSRFTGGDKGTEGLYESWTQRISIDANVAAPLERDLARDWHETWRVADRGRSVKNARGFSTGTFEKTAKEKIQDSFLHELGHHVHLGSHAKLDAIDDLVRAAYSRTGLDSPKLRARVLEGKVRSPAISRYAAKNPAEYFAESFNAYMTEPEALRAEDLNGYTMVAQVLKRLKIER